MSVEKKTTFCAVEFCRWRRLLFDKDLSQVYNYKALIREMQRF